MLFAYSPFISLHLTLVCFYLTMSIPPIFLEAVTNPYSLEYLPQQLPSFPIFS